MLPKAKKAAVEDDVVRIDSHKHDAQLKAIAESHRQYEMELAAAEEEEALDEEEMGSEEGEYDEDFSDIEPAGDVGRIDISFPETTAEFSNSPQCYPPSYYTLSSKERLLLLYAENFRRQFVINYPKRRALVLAIRNECNVEKFVCTSIRPTTFLHIPLIGSVEGCASFVADFIIYEPLEDVTTLVSSNCLLHYFHVRV